MKKHLIQQLKRLKDDPRYKSSEEVLERNWAKIAEAIGPSANENPGLMATLPSYGTWLINQYISRGAVAGAFSLLIIAGGWMTTVRAADSLPGETLYSVKKLSEKAQLRLASFDRRAVLHTTFAERRIQEAADLHATGNQNPEKASLVKEALEASKQEIASAKQDLQSLNASGNAQTLATAISVQANLQNLEVRLDDVVADGGATETAEDALAVKELSKEASDVATDVAVEVHEEQQTEDSAHEITGLFKKTLGEIEARQRFDLQRVQVIRAALNDGSINYDGLVIPDNDDLLAHEHTISVVEDTLSRAMDTFAAGGYRSAFDALKEVDTALLKLEVDLAQMEITIMNARAQTPPPETEEVCVENCEVEQVPETETVDTVEM